MRWLKRDGSNYRVISIPCPLNSLVKDTGQVKISSNRCLLSSILMGSDPCEVLGRGGDK
jgi:hypothetical protein